jgi:hypothetical protein
MPSDLRIVLPERSPRLGTEQMTPPSISIKDALNLIMRRRNIGPEKAELTLREACRSGKVRCWHMVLSTDKGNPKPISFVMIPREAWGGISTIDVDKSSLRTLNFEKFEGVWVIEPELSAWLSRPRRGPPTGTIARFAEADRGLFSGIDRAVAQGLTLTEAVRDLDYEGKVKGRGTSESRVRRVTRLYRKERPERIR